MLVSSTDLTYFLEVARELNFSRAAKKLNVSQPSLSLAIQRLENSLDTSLFIRHKLGVTLTKTGEILFSDTEKLLEQWEETAKNIKAINHVVKGKVRIGCHSTLAHFLMKMVNNLLEQHPGLEIHFQYELTAKVMENIMQGNLDIGIVTDPYPNQDVILQQISVTEFTYWVSNKAESKFDLYDEESVIICDPQLSPTQFLLKELEKKRKNKPFRLSTMNQLENIAAMTAENCGIGILPNAWTELYFKDKLKKIPNAPVYNKPLCLAYRAENKNVMAVQTVLSAIKTLVKR
jgi:DNA-binding transcriptional LysR family regulator